MEGSAAPSQGPTARRRREELDVSATCIHMSTDDSTAYFCLYMETQKGEAERRVVPDSATFSRQSNRTHKTIRAGDNPKHESSTRYESLVIEVDNFGGGGADPPSACVGFSLWIQRRSRFL